ncbi:MAG: hypothetical protein IPG45_24240 [Deltaproteobacteria bacterium]|jgi:hypothetical protein|nr:hypothetical protein [Deltaproteobacteria bacterium]
MRCSACSLALLFSLLAACGSEDTTTDLGAPSDSGSLSDAGVSDLGPVDAADSGLAVDGGGGSDATPDGGLADAELDGGASIDATLSDATPSDATELDAASPGDAGADGGLNDAGADGGPNDAGPGVCNVEGIYSVNIQGMGVYFSFDPTTGAWVGALTLAELTTNPVGGGTYSYTNGQFTIEDAPNGAGCSPGQIGVYAVNFTPTCDAFTLTLISEGCQERGDSLDGATFNR